MLRGVAIAGTLFGAAGLVWMVTARGDADNETPAPYPAIDAEAITGIRIAGPAGEIALSRSPESGWRIIAPIEDDADASAVKAALAELARLEIGPEPVTESAEDWPQFEVAAAEVLTVELSATDDTFPALHIGRGRFVRIGNMSAVYEVFGFSRANLAADLRYWRDRTIFDIEPATVTSIEVIAENGNRVRASRQRRLEPADEPRALPEKVWALAADSGMRAFAESAPASQVPLDADVVADVFRRVISLKAWGVAKGTTFAEAGLESPALTIVIHTRAGARKLAIGERAGGFTPVGVVGEDRVWLLRAREAAQLSLGPRQWRDKTLLGKPADSISQIRVVTANERFALRREGGRWQAAFAEGRKLDVAAVNAYVQALTVAEATEVAPPEARLGTALATITVAFGDARAVTLRVSERGDGTYLAASSARPDLLILDRHTADRILPDLSALTRQVSLP